MLNEMTPPEWRPRFGDPVASFFGRRGVYVKPCARLAGQHMILWEGEIQAFKYEANEFKPAPADETLRALVEAAGFMLKWPAVTSADLKGMTRSDAFDKHAAVIEASLQAVERGDEPMKSEEDLITVCSECHRACCWQGEFMCDESQFASTVQMTRKQLREGNYGEHEDYWKKDDEL